MGTLILDTECYRNFWYLGIKRVEDGRRVGFEYSDRADFDRDRVRYFLKRNQSIGFNSLPYDLPMIYLALDGASNNDLKEASDLIIQNQIPAWRSADAIGTSVPKIDHIDLFETNPSVKRGLKKLNGSMHAIRLKELPFDVKRILSHADMDALIEYCQYGDLDGTEKLFNLLGEPIALREHMREFYGTMDLRSKSDAQVGETIIKSEAEKRHGRRIKKQDFSKPSFRYDVPEWLKFKTPYMQEVLETIRNTDIEVKDGKVQFPKAFEKFKIEFDGMQYTLGLGGLHSTEKNRAVFSDDQSILIDCDVASQYPNIIMKLGLYPEAIGPDFLPVYKSIIDRRLAAKAAKDKATDKGLKIAINGSYGKLGSGYSVLFAPHLMIAVTLTGQLSLMMLIEEASLRGIPAVSGNTDGIVFRCPRSKFNGFVMRDGKPTDRLAPSPIQDVIEWWEAITSFNLEFGEYAAIYSAAVNAYIGLKPDGGYKRKGTFANHWRKDTPWGTANTDFDPTREGLKKSPQRTICADAVLGFLLHGIPIERTILECQDVREFVTISEAAGGATWGPGAPIYERVERQDAKGKTVRSEALVGYEDEFYLGKLVRFYWSFNGNPIIKIKGNTATGNRPKVPSTDGCRPLMDLPEDFSVPEDLDRHAYIEEARSMLISLGWQPPAANSDAPIAAFYRNLLEAM